MPSRSDEPPRWMNDFWDGTWCAYPGCQNVLPEIPDKHDPYCGIDHETQHILDMKAEDDAMADAWEKEQLIAQVEGMY